MASQFSDSFHYYIPPSERAIKAAFQGGMIVFDTNVLLGAYRFAPKARKELLSAIRRVADRVWVPHRVAEEFHKRRIGVINGYDAEYGPVVDALREAQSRIDAELVPKIEQLANRAALADQEKRDLIKLVADSTAKACRAVENLRKQHDLPAGGEGDAILAEFQELFEGKTGGGLAEQDIADAIAEAERRAEQKIPPGFRDAKNPEPYGDYLIWRQTLIEASARRCEYLLFVTGDKKDDWYQVVRGKTIGAQPQLTKEAHRECGAQLIMCDTTSFLYHASQYLEAEVSEETIRQSQLDAKLRAELEREEVTLRHELARLSEFIAVQRMHLMAMQDEAEKLDAVLLSASESETESQETERLRRLQHARVHVHNRITSLKAELADLDARYAYTERHLPREERRGLSQVRGEASPAP